MTADEYIEQVLKKYQVATGPSSPAELTGGAIAPTIRTWAGTQLTDLRYSGSYAKGTGVHGTTDVDLFISLKADTTQTSALARIDPGLLGRNGPPVAAPRRPVKGKLASLVTFGDP